MASITDTFIRRELKKEYDLMKWTGTYWYIPVPRVKYSTIVLPHFSFSIDLYISASLIIDYRLSCREIGRFFAMKAQCALTGKLIKDVAKFDAPLVLLKALAEDNDSDLRL